MTDGKSSRVTRKPQQEVQTDRAQERSQYRARLARLFRVLVPVLLLLLALTLVDRHALITTLAELDGRALIPMAMCGLLVVQIQVMLSALRWRVTASALGFPLLMRDALREYYLASLLNQLLPGGVAGDALRVVRSRRWASLATAAHSVLIERLSGQFVLAIVALLGLLMWPRLMPSPAPLDVSLVVLSVVALGAAVALTWVALHRLSPRLTSVPVLHSLARFALDIGPGVRKVWLQNHAWWRQLSLSLVILASYIALFFVSAAALNAPLPLSAAVCILPLVLLAMSLPTAFGGLGVREVSTAVLWPLLGMTAEQGVLTSILYGLLALLGSTPALLWVVLSRQRR